MSSSKKWISKPALDIDGDPILQNNGKSVLRKSYSVLQDDFFRFMRAAGYDDVERGERGSSEEHLTVTQFKVEQEQRRLEELNVAKTETQAEIVYLQEEKSDAQSEAKEAKARMDDLAPKLKNMEKLAAEFSDNPEELLPNAATLETAKTYRENKAKPLLEKIVKVLRNVAENFERVSRAFGPERISATLEEINRQEQAEKEQKRVSRKRHDK